MELQESQNGKPLLTLTTLEEIEVVSLITNYEWVKYPNVLHPVKRSVHSSLARRAFDAAHRNNDITQPFALTHKETAIVTEGIFNLEDELLHFDPTVSYTTNTLSRDATALSIARSLRALDLNKS